MKNIHILSTDNPSRLVKIYNDVNRETFTLKLDVEVNDLFKEYVNIYITSDEEIKEGDWVITPTNDIIEWAKVFRPNGKKIILTTNTKLIRYGVQKIDDEFLEWFINNSSCEEVEVVDGIYFDDVEWISCYKIIIPKKETKPKTMLESLQEYFKNTPKEKVLEDWNGFQHLDEEGITVKEFLENQKQTDEKGRPLTYWGGLEERKQETVEESAWKLAKQKFEKQS